MQRVLASFDRETDLAVLARELTGASITRTVARLHELVCAPSVTPHDIEARLLARYSEAVAREGVPLMPGAAELVRALTARLPVAVVSNSPEPAVRAVLAATGLIDEVSVVVGAHGWCKPKPDPEPYLKACALLDVDPASCLAYEDSVTGARAAVSAGLHVLVVPAPGVPAGAYPKEARLITSLAETVPASALGGRA